MKKSEYQQFVGYRWNRNGEIGELNLRDDFIMTVGLGGESGEVQEILKKWVRSNYAKLDKEHLKEELGDVLFYLTMICIRHGFTLNEVMEFNFKKLDGQPSKIVRE